MSHVWLLQVTFDTGTQHRMCFRMGSFADLRHELHHERSTDLQVIIEAIAPFAQQVHLCLDGFQLLWSGSDMFNQAVDRFDSFDCMLIVVERPRL